MKLYLSNKQLALLFLPIATAGILFFFEDIIITYMHTVLTQHTMSKNNMLTTEITKYLHINRDMKLYNKTMHKIDSRNNFINWMQTHKLYKNSYVKSQKIAPKYTWNLQAVFPKYDKAIINNKFVHIGSVVNRARVVKIKFDKILLKTSKGFKWVHLFR